VDTAGQFRRYSVAACRGSSQHPARRHGAPAVVAAVDSAGIDTESDLRMGRVA
jgi:hypothetical protein